MAQIHNSDLFKELKEGGKIQQLNDVIPSQLAEKVVPVMEVNPKLLRRAQVIKAASIGSTSSQTVFTTPTDRDFYLTGIFFHFQKDAACDGTGGSVTAVIDGETISLINCRSLSLTACDRIIVRELTLPTKLDRGSIVATTGTFTVGAQNRACSLIGYYDNLINA